MSSDHLAALAKWLNRTEGEMPQPEGECSERKFANEAEAAASVAAHEPCPACPGFPLTAYVCPDWGDHWHTGHIWRPSGAAGES